MNKLIKITCIIALILFLFLNTDVKAATASISASKTNAVVGDNVTITVNIYAATWNVSVSGSGIGDKIVGYNEDAVNENKTKTYTLNTSAAGTYTVQISGDITDANDTKAYPSQSVTVVVAEPVPTPVPEPKPEPKPTPKPSNNTTTNTTPTKSSNSFLAKLQIEEGTISPEFNYKTNDYTIAVPNDITKLTVSAIADSSKATVSISGDEELQVGENKVEITVKAEDGSKSTYTVIATRADEELTLNSLSVYYIDENHNKKVLNLTPEFIFNTNEYTVLDKIPYTVENLEVEALANKELANIEIIGYKALKTGNNEITIKATIKNEAAEIVEEKIYKISVEKEEEPVQEIITPISKIKNWFNFAGISGWIKENYNKIMMGMLIVATTAFVGLTIYFAVDYKKYQELLTKLAEYNKENLMERANVALKPEALKPENNVKAEQATEATNIMKEEVAEEIIDPETAEICAEMEEARANIKRGKRYK